MIVVYTMLFLYSEVDPDTLLEVFKTGCEVIHQSIFQLPAAKDLTPGSTGEVWLKVRAKNRPVWSEIQCRQLTAHVI